MPRTSATKPPTAPDKPAADTPPTDPAPALAADRIAPAVEAILLSTDKAVPPQRLADAIRAAAAAHDRNREDAQGAPRGDDDDPQTADPAPAGSPAGDLKAVRAAVDLLNDQYERTGRSFRVETIAVGYRVMTLPAHAAAVAAFHGQRASTALSSAAIETLAIVAYKQPITRAKLESIRGVACGEILRSLMERRLVTITGRAEELGRPMLYGTTKRFLELFGLASLKDLPPVEELRLRAEGQPSPRPSPPRGEDPGTSQRDEPSPPATPEPAA